jgi:alpha 1,3-mannosyltransferase
MFRNWLARRAICTLLSTVLVTLLFISFRLRSNSFWLNLLPPAPSWSHTSTSPQWPGYQAHIANTTEYWANTPLSSPYKTHFGELGRRVRVLREWVAFIDAQHPSPHRHETLEAVENGGLLLFPFLARQPQNPSSTTPLTDLRSSFVDGARGIVIPTGTKTLRYTFHLIASLKEILRTQLPIQVAYAGDEDLDPSQRKLLSSRFPDIEFLDVTALLDDGLLQLNKGGWAIKAFAALVAPFQEVLLLDADSVLLQPPEVFFDQKAYTDNGALLFHDRLIWQHAFQERHDWWRSQIRSPSETLNKSLVWTEDYAEEGDSGAVVIDKSRLDVLLGLLHVAWQNTEAVREEVTYKITYGDKESWWFGFELAGSSYAFERHYGTMIGWPRESEQKVCSFVIGHVDENDTPLWYNGGLLKNKKVRPNEFGVPTHWMMDGIWEKGADRTQMSCMVGAAANPLLVGEKDIIAKAIEEAQQLDLEFRLLTL